MKFILFTLILLLSACSTNQILRTGEVTAQGYLLTQQFDLMVVKLDNLPLTAPERTAMNGAVDDARRIMDRYDSVEAALIEIPVAQYRIEQMKGAFLDAQEVYQAYLSRTNTDPNPDLEYYETLAIQGYDTAKAYLANLQPGTQVGNQFGADQLMLLFRVIGTAAAKKAIE